jgi:DNA-binding NtrC family response regulator
MASHAESVRALRLRCWLAQGGTELPGHTATVGARTASLRFEGGLLERAALDPDPDARRDRRIVTLRLPDGEGVLRLEAELTWLRHDEREVGGSAVTGVGVAWVGLSPANREALEALCAGHRHTALVLAPSPHESERLRALLAPALTVRVARDAGEARAVFEERAVSVLIVGRSVDQPIAALRGLETALGVAMTVPLVLAAHADEGASEFFDLGRVYSVLGGPLQDDLVEKLVHRAIALHELTVENTRLNVEVERVNQRLAQENTYLRRRLSGPSGFERIVGSSPALLRSLGEIQRARRTDATVFIQGETGTGKELVARALHAGGPRAPGPFVAQNCAGIPETLLQSALFGHVKGAFTGADRAQTGVFQEAHGGTLFLDEVADLSMAVQASLLRVLQEREVTPVGSPRAVKVDVRIVSASHKDLREETRAGRFREDLLYRLVVVTLKLPPLRERLGDIALLCEHFLDLHCTRHGKRLRGVSAEALRLLQGHTWPGNVRELENEVERAVVMADDGGLLTPELFADHLRAGPLPAPSAQEAERGVFVPFETPYDEAFERLERALVERALALDPDNLAQAARRLGVKRTRLFKIRARLRRGE